MRAEAGCERLQSKGKIWSKCRVLMRWRLAFEVSCCGRGSLKLRSSLRSWWIWGQTTEVMSSGRDSHEACLRWIEALIGLNYYGHSLDMWLWTQRGLLWGSVSVLLFLLHLVRDAMLHFRPSDLIDLDPSNRFLRCRCHQLNPPCSSQPVKYLVQRYRSWSLSFQPRTNQSSSQRLPPFVHIQAAVSSV